MSETLEPTAADQPTGEPIHRSGYITICGYPNAGKSTLLNHVLDFRLGIVTAKPQTTRRRTLGILTTTTAQMIFIDTPGILEPRYDLQAAMMKQVGESLSDADLLLYLVDVSDPRIAPGVLAASARKPVLVALNKADLLPKAEDALPLIEKLQAGHTLAGFHTISALRGKGIDELLRACESLLPPGPQFYPPDQLTEHPERFFVGELIREAVFELYRKEIPYSTEVEIDEFREQSGRKDLIRATVFVEAPSQKGILIGQKGLAIKALGQRARTAVEEFLGREVFLELRVKVMPKWRRNARALNRFGY